MTRGRLYEDRALCLTVAGFGAQDNPQGYQHRAEIWEICVACVNDLLAVVTVLKVSLCEWLLLLVTRMLCEELLGPVNSHGDSNTNFLARLPRPRGFVVGRWGRYAYPGWVGY